MLNVTTQIEPEDNNIVTVEQQLEEPSLNEVKMAIEMLKRGKTPRENSIPQELLKKGRSTLLTSVQQLINTIWKEETIPKP